MFTRVLIANRGEIAVRIMRTLRQLNIESVAVFSARDRHSLHVRCADRAVQLPDSDATGGYLDSAALVAIAVAYQCDALHPGYGFVSENPDLPRACAEAGIVFIGPTAESMESLGDKARAREVAMYAQVPVVPGTDVQADALAMQLPLLIKPVAGGGGKGMHVVSDFADFNSLIERAQREARAAFADDRLLFERYLPRARHIEVQVAGLSDGRVLAIGDRECTLQRRHQKVMEEAPAIALPDDVRQRIHAAAIAVVARIGYRNLGTVEFVMSCDDPNEWYFLEVNTRLQVEHPVTEAVTGVDLVELQLLIAAGEDTMGKLGEHNRSDALTHLIANGSVPSVGHAIEARVYAENPAKGFLPTGGRVVLFDTPRRDFVRVDAGVDTGDVVGSGYDPMIAKVIASGPSRAAAMSELDAALAETALLGMPNNLSFLRQLLAHEAVTSGHMDTRLLDRENFSSGETLPDDVALAWAVLRTQQALQRSQGDSLWSGGWRIGSSAPFRWRGECADSSVTARVTEVIDQPMSFHVALGDGADGTSADGQSRSVVLCVLESVDESAMRITCEGFSREFRWALGRDIDGETMWLSAAGNTWSIRHSARLPRGIARDVLAPEVLSPMPGTVLAILVASDAQVLAGQPLLALEAMKMEHQVLAPHDGTVTSISCEVGSHVRMREVLITVEPQQ